MSAAEKYVYVATNPAMEGIVKIGHTAQQDPDSRITALFTTGVPVPFVLEYAAAVDDPRRVERALQSAFEPQRLHPRREFFAVKAAQVVAILELLDKDVTEEEASCLEAKMSQEDRDSRERARRRPVFTFSDLGVPVGSLLTFEENDGVKTKVVDNRRVKLVALPPDTYPAVEVDDEPRYLSPLTAALTGRIVAPTGYWRVEGGRTLLELYNEAHGPR